MSNTILALIYVICCFDEFNYITVKLMKYKEFTPNLTCDSVKCCQNISLMYYKLTLVQLYLWEVMHICFSAWKYVVKVIYQFEMSQQFGQIGSGGKRHFDVSYTQDQLTISTLTLMLLYKSNDRCWCTKLIRF